MPDNLHDNTELNREKRRQARLERLGMNKLRCKACGESDDRCFDHHHLAGRKNSPFTVLLCKNCHAKLSDHQKDQPKQAKAPSDPIEAIGFFLLGLADLFELLVEKLREFGLHLIGRARSSLAESVS